MRMQRSFGICVALLGGIALVAVAVLWERPIQGPHATQDLPAAGSLAVFQGPTPRDMPDPAEEGWETEVTSDRAEAQLKALGRLLVDSAALNADSLSGLLSETFSCSQLSPQPLVTVFHQGGIRVERGVSSAADPHKGRDDYRGAAGLAQALQPLTNPLLNVQARRADFKMFRIEITEDRRFTTRQYLSISGRTPSGMLEINATWNIEWVVPADQSRPRLQRIESEAMEQVTTTHPHGPLFSDCTVAALGQNDSFSKQINPGHSHWGRLIEHHLHFDPFGHHGLAVGDVNGDGRDDVYRCQPGGIPNRLYVSQEDGTLKECSSEAGVDFLDNTRSALVIDLDNDGDQDMALVLFDELLLLENDGTGKFSLRKQFHPLHHGYSQAAADFDLDGDLDVYVCSYYPSGETGSEFPAPVPYYDANNGGRNHLFRNDGQWQFHDATVETGMDMNNRRFSYAAAWEDYDNDGDPDLCVANDFGRNNLYRNDGGHFVDVASDVGLEDGAFGMSVSFADANRDGWMDLYVGNMFSAAGGRVTYQQDFQPEATDTMRASFRRLTGGNSLFLNSPHGRFQDVSTQAGVTMGRWSWSSLFMDVNNDGWEDLIVANGFITGEETKDL